ncbi:MAG: glycerol-3-phosphate dehydrogenase/oxidase [Promethearchaeota archaeon]
MISEIARIDFSSKNRGESINKLMNDVHDILIIGGGVTGAGIARDATLRGFKVALVDKNDFAFGTSSRSSKLAHGGFRYLKSFEFSLVREAESERNWLRRDFPNLVRPFPVLTPSFDGDKYSMNLIWLGVSLYNLLDGYKNYKKGVVVRDPSKIQYHEPGMDATGLRGFGIVHDTYIDDARLTIESIKEAVYTGRCVAVNYIRVLDLERDDAGKVSGAWVRDEAKDSGEKFLIRARIVVSATGIWTDEIMRNKPAGFAGKVIRPTKGVHVIFKKEDVPVEHALGISSHVDGRFFFILNRENFIVIGTTDTDYNDDLDEPVCNKEDAEYLLSTVRLKFPTARLSLDRMIGSYAGVRPLALPKMKRGQSVSESDVSRNHVIIHGDDDLLAICGGKLTTYRVMAEDLMQKHVLKLARKKIPGRKFNARRNIARKRFLISMTKEEWASSDLVKEFMETKVLDEHQLYHIYKQYGRGGIEILQIVKDAPVLGERIVDDEETKYAPWILAEVQYTVLHDAPFHLIDILARRFEFQWMVHPSKQPRACRKVANLSAELLGWDDDRKQEEISRYLEYLRRNSFFYNKPLR